MGKDCSNHNVHVGNFSYFGRTSSLCSLSGYSRFRYRSSPLPPAERVLSFASKLTAWPPSAPSTALPQVYNKIFFSKKSPTPLLLLSFSVTKSAICLICSRPFAIQTPYSKRRIILSSFMLSPKPIVFDLSIPR